MNRPDIERIKREIEVLADPTWRIVDHCGALLDYIAELEADLFAARHIISSQPLEPPTVIAKPDNDYVR